MQYGGAVLMLSCAFALSFPALLVSKICWVLIQVLEVISCWNATSTTDNSSMRVFPHRPINQAADNRLLGYIARANYREGLIPICGLRCTHRAVFFLFPAHDRAGGQLEPYYCCLCLHASRNSFVSPLSAHRLRILQRLLLALSAFPLAAISGCAMHGHE